MTSRGEWRPAFADVGDQYVVAIGSSAYVAATFAAGAPVSIASSPGTPAKKPAADVAIAESGAPAKKSAKKMYKPVKKSEINSRKMVPMKKAKKAGKKTPKRPK